MAVDNKKRLGRGLDALLGGYPGEQGSNGATALSSPARRTVPITALARNPRNPRREFRPEDLQELAASLKQHGIVQPLVVRPAPGTTERYELIAGERRWRAAQLAGLHEVPVTVLDVSDGQALELAIVENVQRADLNAVEEARGYQALIDEFGYTQADLGSTIGKSRVHVANTLRLLKLPPPVLALIESGKLSAGHGRALLQAHDPADLAATILARGLSVRETEWLAQSPDAVGATRRKPIPKHADLQALEKELTDFLGLKVEIRHGSEGRGQLRIDYRNLEQLDVICRKMRS